MKPLAIALMIALSAGVKADEPNSRHSYKPAEGYVPDANTAIAIAVAIWTPIYSAEKIKSEKPYKAELKDGVWYVSGSLKEGWRGGVAEAEIAKDDARIIRVSHGK